MVAPHFIPFNDCAIRQVDHEAKSWETTSKLHSYDMDTIPSGDFQAHSGSSWIMLGI